MFNKPIERMMIRYDRQPSDFSNLLEPAFDSLNDKNGQKLTRRIVNNFGGIVFERPSSGTYLTLSRCFEFRYIFTNKPVQCNITFVYPIYLYTILPNVTLQYFIQCSSTCFNPM